MNTDTPKHPAPDLDAALADAMLRFRADPNFYTRMVVEYLMLAYQSRHRDRHSSVEHYLDMAHYYAGGKKS